MTTTWAPPPPALWAPARAPRTPAPLSLAVRALTAGAVAAAAVPGHRVGVGLVVAVLVVALVVTPVARLRTPSGAALAATAAGLVLVAAVRDAGWVVGTCLLAALACWSLLLSDGRRWGEAALGTLAVPAAWVPAVAWVLRPLGALGRGHRASAVPALRGAAVALGLLAVFGGLFLTADAAFRELVGRLAVPTPGLSLVGRALALLAAAGLVGAAATVLCVAMPPTPPARDVRPLRPVEWVLPLLALDMLFAAFVAVQATVLFGGRDHVLATAGLTYAQHARQGFGQLVVVALLTLAVVAVTVRVVPRPDRRVQVLLGVLCLLTLVVLASASRRLGLYEQEYGFTRLRVSVDAAIAWLGAVLVLVMAAGLRRRAAWLPRAVVLSAAAGLLVFAAADPEARIAARNAERFTTTGDLDVGYLAGLSADAVPALARLPEPQRSCALAGRQVAADPWAGWNASRDAARDVLLAAPVATCAGLVPTPR